jgi:hypothetical protein
MHAYMCDAGGKYIYVARRPEPVCSSFYSFLLSYTHVSPSQISIRDFVMHLFAGRS